MSQSSSRRHFVKLVVGVSGLTLLAPSLFGQQKRRPRPGSDAAAGAGGDLALPLVKPGEGMAASLHYVHKNTDIKDAKLKTVRAGVPFEKQTCTGCMLYTKAGMKDGAEVGKCSLFAGHLVKGQGWCQSWAKKA